MPTRRSLFGQSLLATLLGLGTREEASAQEAGTSERGSTSESLADQLDKLRTEFREFRAAQRRADGERFLAVPVQPPGRDSHGVRRGVAVPGREIGVVDL